MNSILFDFGGTLDTNGIHWSEKFWELYQKQGMALLKPDYEDAYRYSEKIMAEYTSADMNIDAMIDRQIHIQATYLKEEKGISFPDGAISAMIFGCQWDVYEQAKRSYALLHTLKKHYRLGLVSNFNGNLEAVIRDFFPERIFDVLIDSAIENVSKPDPEIYRLAINRLHTEPEQVWMVGDSYDRDISPAKEIGCTTIWLKGKSWKEEINSTNADFIIYSLDEVQSIVLG